MKIHYLYLLIALAAGDYIKTGDQDFLERMKTSIQNEKLRLRDVELSKNALALSIRCPKFSVECGAIIDFITLHSPLSLNDFNEQKAEFVKLNSQFLQSGKIKSAKI